MREKRPPGPLTGALVGLLLTAALLAIFYLTHALLGLPFIAFDLIDWMARNLPGAVITFGIDLLVALIRGFDLGSTDATAKAAEQMIGVIGVLGIGAIAGALFFAFMRPRRLGSSLVPGLLLGLIVGAPLALLSNATNFISEVDPLLRAAWLLAGFAAWGVAIQWIYNDLRALDDSTRVEAEGLDRRTFLIRVGGATATITVIGAGLGALLRADSPGETARSGGEGEPLIRADLPNADDPLIPAPGTRPEYTPISEHYRIDISISPPNLSGDDYTLPIFGLVSNPLDLTLDDIRAYESMDQFITMACISNPIGGDLISTTRWTGVSMQKLLADLDTQAEARYLRIYGADGFDETLPIEWIEADERIMLTYDWDGAPLPRQNGFPLRIYIPNRFGMKQPKWITEIEVVAEGDPGDWVRRGWSQDAFMVATSVIDTVAQDALVEADGTLRVPVGGIAHAGDRGISKVEVRVDDGEWTEAQLRRPLSDTTWVVWRYDWPFAEGAHTFAVRCHEGDGTLQLTERRGVRPDGATGTHTVNANLTAPATDA